MVLIRKMHDTEVGEEIMCCDGEGEWTGMINDVKQGNKRWIQCSATSFRGVWVPDNKTSKKEVWEWNHFWERVHIWWVYTILPYTQTREREQNKAKKSCRWKCCTQSGDGIISTLVKQLTSNPSAIRCRRYQGTKLNKNKPLQSSLLL